MRRLYTETAPSHRLIVQLSFEKYEGLGNDFLVVDDPSSHDALTPSVVAQLCDRHRGVGADGVLLTGFVEDRPFMRVINADGSRPEMCGNGLRCVAIHLLPRVNAVDWEIDTDAGPHRIRTAAHGQVEVWMTPAVVSFVDEEISVGDRRVLGTFVSMGNPHVVTFDALDPETVKRIAPLLGTHERFPDGANVGFASPGDTGIGLRVFERGAGWTEACGTGACAAAVAAVETGRALRGETTQICLPGGTLDIVVGEPGDAIRMKGPAKHVFGGTLELSRRSLR